MYSYKKFITLFAFLLAVITTSYCQNQKSIEKREKELIQKEEQRKAENAAALEEMQKNHMQIQTKATRKRMKKAKKKAKKVNDNKGTFFLIRWMRKIKN